MSPIGKIFIVINLVLAVLFLGWASANLANANKYKDWYEAEVDAKAELETDLQGQISELRTEHQQAQNDKQGLLRDKGDLEASSSRLQSDLNKSQASNADLLARVEGIEGKLGEMTSTVDSVSARAETAENKATEAQDARHAAEDAMAAAEAKVDGLERSLKEAGDALAQLEVRLNSTGKELTDTQTALQILQERTNTSATELIQQKLINGAVVMVSYEIDPGIVLINRGSADGVALGYSFEVYAGSQYKGRVRVTNVHENSCSAVIEKTYEGRQISQGDSAATNI